MNGIATTTGPKPSLALLGVSAASLALAWSWWPALRQMGARWSEDPRYSHGFLVAPFAVYMLWSRRSLLPETKSIPVIWGLTLVAVGSLLGMAGSRFYLGWVEGLAPLISLSGLAVLARGWSTLKWAGPSIAFLIFMVPLPYRVETAMGYPLQRAATMASTYALQTLGLPALAEGNIILIEEARIGVVEACNGLGMLLTFFAVSTAVSLLVDRPWLDRVLILLSAAPIAFLANVFRITLTGILHHLANGKAADAFYHDLAGWLMMPMALLAFGAELKLLSLLFVEPPHRDNLPAIGLIRGLGIAASPSRPPTPEGGKS